jgi:hypothetical protein
MTTAGRRNRQLGDPPNGLADDLGVGVLSSSMRNPKRCSGWVSTTPPSGAGPALTAPP